MEINTETYVRKPLLVEAIRVTSDNFDDVVAWSHGTVLNEENARLGTTKKYIKIDVYEPKNPKQAKAFIGDWVLYTSHGGFKIFTDKAFRASFEKQTNAAQPEPSAGEDGGSPQPVSTTEG